MTTADFRCLALALPESAEHAHMDHPDFRVHGKIFATLSYPARGWGMVKLTPEQQYYFSKEDPEIFVLVKGSWGRRGATSVHLKNVDKATLKSDLRRLAQHRTQTFRGAVRKPVTVRESGSRESTSGMLSGSCAPPLN